MHSHVWGLKGDEFLCPLYFGFLQNKNYKETLNKILKNTLKKPFCKNKWYEKVFEEASEIWMGKGQVISKCPFGVFKSSKKPMKIFPGFLP